MIRRSPTRIELKLEDLADFDYIQKVDKKKTPNTAHAAVGGISAADAQKLMRQDRIGFRPIRSGGASGSGAGGNGNDYPASGTGDAAAAANSGGDAGPGLVTLTRQISFITTEVPGDEVSTNTNTPGTGTASGNTNRTNIADMDISGEDPDDAPTNFTAEGNISNVDMSLDESL